MSENMENRKYKRVKENVNIKVDIIESDEVQLDFEIGKSKDISASGILFKYDKLIDIGKKIKISFLSPKSFDFINCNAAVVRVEFIHENCYDIGVSFLGMSESEEKRLNYYLTYN